MADDKKKAKSPVPLVVGLVLLVLWLTVVNRHERRDHPVPAPVITSGSAPGR
jgi:hypothetical protein